MQARQEPGFYIRSEPGTDEVQRLCDNEFWDDNSCRDRAECVNGTSVIWIVRVKCREKRSGIDNGDQDAVSHGVGSA